MRIKTLLASALAAASLGAHADPTFVAELHGSGSYWYENGIPGCNNDPAQWNICQSGWTTLDWQGALSASTTSAADGTYSYGSGLEAMSWRTNVAGDPFDYRAGDQQQWFQPFEGGDPFLTGLAPGASVTIKDGRIVSIDADWVWYSGNPTAFSGMGVNETTTADQGSPNTDVWDLSGTLTAVPEAAAAWMLVAGLVGLAATGRRVTRA
ncbi:MAG: hypothetical protein ACTHL8_05330 [Burkholderiaceae bacterium]